MPKYNIQLEGVIGRATVDADFGPTIETNISPANIGIVTQRKDMVLRFKKGDQTTAEFSLDAVQGWWQDE